MVSARLLFQDGAGNCKKGYSETNMAGSSDPTKRAVSVLKEAITKLEESYHLASSSTSDNSSDAVGMASTSASTSSTSREDAQRDFRQAS